MSLEKYNEKRDFKQTAEPKGKKAKPDDELVFVIQKHAASHLHYDFRLEMDGVLKSWAVPKGPSLDPEIKRLAMMVEDHPYDYKDFEGNIPQGNYGAGNVIVWDQGTYLPSGEFKGTPENALKHGLHKGHISFVLKGKKLKGEFSLIKTRGRQENAWLLLKKEDKYATTDDVLKKDKSVISRQTLEALEKKNSKLTDVNHKPKSVKSAKALTKSKTSNKTKPPTTGNRQPTTNNKQPATFLKPTLANTTEKPFDDPDWVFEKKYDGYRAIAVVNTDRADLFSRNEISFNEDFKPIAESLQKLQHSAVLDGEVVVEDTSGKSGFQLLQNYIKTNNGELKYYVFDLLELDGNDITTLTLLERKQLLQILLQKAKLKNVFYSQHIAEKGLKFFASAEKEQAEGIMAKRADSVYNIGQRTNDWLKIKISQAEEALIIGITEPKKSRSHFGALLLGQYDGKQLKYIGKCGTGFTEKDLAELYKKFQPLFTDDMPVAEKPKLYDKIQWLKPKLVCQVKFTEWTADDHLRHPVFLGLRIDKKPADVQFPNKKDKPVKKEKKSVANDYDLKVAKVTLHLTNQNKIYFPKDKITKGDIVDYYSQVADLMLPYLKNRPQSMNRFPNGINGPSFYQKDVDTEKIPSWLKTAALHSDSNDADIDYLICNDKATLLYMANLGCIEINPWNSTLKKPDHPDWVVIDIDPATDNFQEVIQTALTVKEVMDELGADCYCKTSGASGLHVYIPLGAKYDYNTVKIFAELIAREVQARLPEITTLERSIKKRNKKIYVDFLQNRKGQTLAAPYSVRPKPGATVSTPVEWSEVNENLSPSQFTIENVLDRFAEKGDLWQPVLGKGINIKAILKQLEAKSKA